jgi:hypothetical protein
VAYYIRARRTAPLGIDEEDDPPERQRAKMSTLPSDNTYKIGLGPNDPFPADDDGYVILSDMQAHFLCLLHSNRWRQHPDYRDVRPRDYILMIMRDIYYVPDDILEMIEDELLDKARLYKPHRDYLRSLCCAAMGAEQKLAALAPAMRRRQGRRRVRL